MSFTYPIDTFSEVEGPHQQGVKLAKLGDIEAARACYGEAEANLSGITPGYSQRCSIELHRARISRDQAFLSVRQWMADDGKFPTFYLGHAEDGLLRSALTSSELVDLGRDTFDVDAWKTIAAEHGATIGLSARVALLQTVLGISDESEIGGVVQRFEEAEHYLRQGNNGYYGASNAIRAAGAEKLAGASHRRVSMWAGRSLVYASTAAGSRDAIKAIATFGSNARKLTSKKSVEQGTRRDP